MRNITLNKRRCKRQNNSGCSGCFLRLSTFVITIILVVLFCYKLYDFSGLKDYFLELKYPIRYSEYVEEYSSEFSLEDGLIYAIIRTESKFDPYAVSSNNAKGLMQIQDETAIDCAKELKVKNYTTDMIFEPRYNIQIGSYYISKLVKMYDGDVDLALAAYNGGPGNVNKWLKNPEYTNEYGELIHIPFPETENYVKKVKETKEVYRELLYKQSLKENNNVK